MLWAMLVISFATYKMYSVVEVVDVQTNFLYTTTVGILSLVIAFYIKLRRDEQGVESKSIKQIKKELKDEVGDDKT